MPKKADAETRRRQITEALWRVSRRDGWDAVTMRHVAAEAGVSVGMVQHHFASKDEMLRFALDQIGQRYGERIVARIGALPEPRDPRRVVEVVLDELLPRDDEGQVEVQAAAAFLGRAVLHPEIATSLATAGERLARFLAEQIRLGQPDPPLVTGADVERDAVGLLALVDGLLAHLFTRRLSLATFQAIVAAQLDRIFGPRAD